MNIKTKLDVAGQKVTGIAQQIKGEAEIKTGHQWKGTKNKAQGKIKETVADVRTKLDK